MPTQDNLEPAKPPQAPGRSLRGILGELLWGALFLIIILGGVGLAFYNADIPLPGAVPTAAPTPALAQTTICAGAGCLADPGRSCGQPAIRAVVENGRKRYFTPDNPAYAGAVTLDPARGDRWFCTATQAEANGFQRAQ